jgi:hypothetical protein
MSEQRVFAVNYSDGEKVLIKAVSWKKLDDVRLLCYEILKEVVEKEGEITEIITPSNKVFWGHARKLSKLLPVVGSEEKLNLDRIDDIDQIVDIFICSISSIDYSTGALKAMSPSQICRIHSINFQKLLQKAFTELEEQ